MVSSIHLKARRKAMPHPKIRGYLPASCLLAILSQTQNTHPSSPNAYSLARPPLSGI
jgi:hypothetical protein